MKTLARMSVTIIAGMAAIGAMLLADPGEVKAQPDPFSQSEFPCEEDEVLGFAPRFGPDRVGCIHIDELMGGDTITINVYN